MLGLFRRASARRVEPALRTSLRLEALEWRDQPSVTPLGTPAPGGMVLMRGHAGLPNAAPVIEDFAAEQIVNGLFHITGKVVDENPDGLVVTFGGGTSANGQTVTATADGTFSFIFQFGVNGFDSGFLTAKTTDRQGLTSANVQVFIDPAPV